MTCLKNALKANNKFKATGSILRAFILAGDNSSKSKMLFKHGSVCMKGRKIVSIGHNSTRTYYNGVVCSSFHAEVSAMSKLSNKYLPRKKGPRVQLREEIKCSCGQDQQ